MASVGHHAAGPALGYLFQSQVALLRLLPVALRDDPGAVSLELFDDAALHTDAGPPREVLQIHHSLNSNRPLLDTSAKTWRTLTIWAEERRREDPEEECARSFVSTSSVRTGGALEALTTGALRSVERALTEFTRIAEDPAGASGTADDRRRFLALENSERRALLSTISVLDGSPPAVEVRHEIESLLKGSVESARVPAMADLVEGWWWQRVVRALSERIRIQARDLRAVIDDARRQLSAEALPVRTLSEFDRDDVPTVADGSAAFINCIRAIEGSTGQVAHAIDDYLRASAHRSYWLRRALLGASELTRYDERLLDEWDRRAERILRRRSSGNSEPAASSGQDLYEQLQFEVREPLRSELPHLFIQRGSLHTLADDGRLAWHPDALVEMQKALRAVRAR